MNVICEQCGAVMGDLPCPACATLPSQPPTCGHCDELLNALDGHRRGLRLACNKNASLNIEITKLRKLVRELARYAKGYEAAVVKRAITDRNVVLIVRISDACKEAETVLKEPEQ